MPGITGVGLVGGDARPMRNDPREGSARRRLTTAILCSIIMAGVAELCLLWRREAR